MCSPRCCLGQLCFGRPHAVCGSNNVALRLSQECRSNELDLIDSRGNLTHIATPLGCRWDETEVIDGDACGMGFYASSVRATVVGLVLWVAAMVVCLLAVGTWWGQRVDEAAMVAVSGVFGVDGPTAGVLAGVQIPVLGLAAAVLVVVCVHQRSWQVAVRAMVIVVGGIGAAVVLKEGLVRPSRGIGAVVNSFPSNTVAGFTALGVALILSVPAAQRLWIAAPILAIAVVVSWDVVALQWHRPSDVLGAWLLVAAASAFAPVCASVLSAIAWGPGRGLRAGPALRRDAESVGGA